jgi:hypothetical protein
LSPTPSVNPGGYRRPQPAGAPELTVPADPRSPSIETGPRRGDGADPRGDRRFYMYVIAMLAVGDTVAVIFVLKTAIYLLL